MIVSHPRIITHSESGPNGWLVPIWNEMQDSWRPAQVYLTVVAPGAQKGPHLHMRRCGRFTCIRGDVRIVAKMPSGYKVYKTGERSDFATITIPPGIPAAIYNDGAEEAFVLNMPSPAWRSDDPDEWPVEHWEYS